MSDYDEKNKNVPVPVPNASSFSASKGCGLLLTSIGGVMMIVTLFCVLTVISGVTSFADVWRSVGDFIGANPRAQVVSSRTLITNIQPLGQLVSVSVDVAKADIEVRVDGSRFNLCNYRANHVASGTIEAGIDFTALTEDSIIYDEATNTYTITLPPANLTSCRVDYIRQYERSGANPGCGADWDQVRLLANYDATTEFAQDVLDNGILSRAEREASLLMESFVTALTSADANDGATVNIVYATAETPASLPGSCTPQIPGGWEFDEELNAWTRTD
ncbi:MAG: DUF4230 domain-containing protein [Anaerolineae bacterium]